MNKPPTPAAVRAAMKPAIEPLTPEENRAVFHDDRSGEAILRDHIRAVCAEMRAKVPSGPVGFTDLHLRMLLERFADRLEGRES